MAPPLASIWSSLGIERRFLTWFLPSRDLTAGRTFDAFCRDRFEKHGRTLAAAILAIALLWWPADLVILHHLPEAFWPYSLWRLGVSAICIVYLALPRAARVSRYGEPLLLGFMAAGCAVVGGAQGPLGGPETPWFHLLYVVPFLTLLLPVTFGARVAWSAAMSLSALAGYIGPNPGYLASPFIPWMLGFYGATTLLSIGLGHALHALLRENFEQAVTLEARVRDRSAELQRLLVALGTAREDERRRLAQDLHDELGQELTALRFALGMTRHTYRAQPDGMDRNLEELERLLDRAGAAARDLVQSMSPRVLDELGFGRAAEWLVRRAAERSGADCTIEIAPGAADRLSPDGRVAAFRILQEALTNVVRHAEASHVAVSVSGDADGVFLRVRDNGAGLYAAAEVADRPLSFGLSGMRERATLAGGRLEVEAATAGGTEVVCWLPAGAP